MRIAITILLIVSMSATSALASSVNSPTYQHYTDSLIMPTPDGAVEISSDPCPTRARACAMERKIWTGGQDIGLPTYAHELGHVVDYVLRWERERDVTRQKFIELMEMGPGEWHERRAHRTDGASPLELFAEVYALCAGWSFDSDAASIQTTEYRYKITGRQAQAGCDLIRSATVGFDPPRSSTPPMGRMTNWEEPQPGDCWDGSKVVPCYDETAARAWAEEQEAGLRADRLEARRWREERRFKKARRQAIKRHSMALRKRGGEA